MERTKKRKQLIQRQISLVLLLVSVCIWNVIFRIIKMMNPVYSILSYWRRSLLHSHRQRGNVFLSLFLLFSTFFKPAITHATARWVFCLIPLYNNILILLHSLCKLSLVHSLLWLDLSVRFFLLRLLLILFAYLLCCIANYLPLSLSIFLSFNVNRSNKNKKEGVWYTSWGTPEEREYDLLTYLLDDFFPVKLK